MQYNHTFFMTEALREAQKAFNEDEVPVGAVIVANNKIIARAHNLTEHLNDVTAHAEMQAITAATHKIGGKYLTDCTLYVTLEPCIMCGGALGWSQLKKVVFGAKDIKKGFSTLEKNILHPKTLVEGGILKEECEKLLNDFFAKKRK
jgi:tRNA(adenine34) deaminase